MTNKEFAEKILNISARHWAYVLTGQRHLSFKKAKKVSTLFETSSELWINPDANAKERKAAWSLFQKRMYPANREAKK